MTHKSEFKKNIIAFAAQKGGVGKSTCSLNVAQVFANMGYKVLLIDADPQKTITKWMDERNEKLKDEEEFKLKIGNKFDYLSVRVNGVQVAIEENSKLYDLVIMDSAGVLDNNTKQILILADLVIMPLKPSAFDIDATAEAWHYSLDAISAGGSGEIRLLLNMVNAQASVTKKVIQSLDGLPLLSTKLGNRTLFPNSLMDSLTAVEQKPLDKASLEIKALAEEVINILKGINETSNQVVAQ